MYVGGHGGYICIHTEQYCRVTRESLEAFLGHSFELSQMELAIVAFAGKIRFGDKEIVWYSEN
ncbi:MmoB/DmpM family protein [Chroococcidiopsis sp. FACHB-1243]|uniref:MmoB/DmpM family protein n=1 Tax=Chroococcidiopsis sp. [FACHB-1243] TaxID=2692781 RepID=UPI00178051C6|nr:MmoB/DmpM family protein [Chroococcidiopsis sp. [FACHB-1243]]